MGKKQGSSLLRQGDLGGGQRSPDERPVGTAPVGRFAEEGGAPPRTDVEPWRVSAGEAEAAAEDGFRGAEQVRREDAIAAGFQPHGALYEGPERRRCQADAARWALADRRTRPFEYASRQRS